MDTIVIATGMPFFLGFLDQSPDDVVAMWEAWTRSGELVAARHEDPARDAIVRLRPASMGVVEFIPNEQAGRKVAERMLWSLPHLQGRPDSSDLPPEHAHFWTLSMSGFSATPERLPQGRTGLVLGHWEIGRL